MIRKINSKCSSPINHLNVNNEELDSPRDIADALASTFAKKSSSENYSEQFQRNKAKEEKKKLSFKSNNTEHYTINYLHSKNSRLLSKKLMIHVRAQTKSTISS